MLFEIFIQIFATNTVDFLWETDRTLFCIVFALFVKEIFKIFISKEE